MTIESLGIRGIAVLLLIFMSFICYRCSTNLPSGFDWYAFRYASFFLVIFAIPSVLAARDFRVHALAISSILTISCFPRILGSSDFGGPSLILAILVSGIIVGWFVPGGVGAAVLKSLLPPFVIAAFLVLLSALGLGFDGGDPMLLVFAVYAAPISGVGAMLGYAIRHWV